MKNDKVARVLTSVKEARVQLAKLTTQQKSQLEKSWDVEHAYYSSVLEGSDLDRHEFDKLAEKIA